MKRLTAVLIATALLATFAGVASANPYAPRIERREVQQRLRIRQGVRRGDLTRREAMRLRMRGLGIRRMELRARADGRVTQGERWRLERALDRRSRTIFRLRQLKKVLECLFSQAPLCGALPLLDFFPHSRR